MSSLPPVRLAKWRIPCVLSLEGAQEAPSATGGARCPHRAKEETCAKRDEDIAFHRVALLKFGSPAGESHADPRVRRAVQSPAAGFSPAQAWAVAVFLLLLPVAVYWPTIAAPFGFRDDYSILREAQDEPGKILRVCSMQARPIYGWVLEWSFGRSGSIAHLSWIRGLSAAVLGAVAAAFFLVLRKLKWDGGTAALVAALIAMLPSSQVTASWAVAWPLGLSALLALLGFACTEHAFDPAAILAGGARIDRGDAVARRRLRKLRVWRALGWWAVSVLFVTASALTYQPNALFYLSGVAAALWTRRRWANRSSVEWFIRHVVTLGVGLVAAFTVMVVAFAQEWVPASRRVAFEQDWPAKLEWFVRQPLQNALGLIALNHDGGAPAVHRLAALVGVLIVAGLLRSAQVRGWRHGVWWAAALGALMLGSFIVNLAVSDRWPAYRVLLPLTATITVALTIALLALGGRPLARFGLLALLVPGVWLAREQTYALFARPQALELKLVQTGASRIDPDRHPHVFVLTPTDDEYAGHEVFKDEFGSLSTNSYWTAKEMIKLLMLERYPRRRDVVRDYTFDCGPTLPPGGKFDVVIDLHRIRDFRPR